ncbi:MAG: CpaF family protein [Vampirovibrionales bacterium]|nr:CpaF family protein [Vampirovibrionales bacterium]
MSLRDRLNQAKNPSSPSELPSAAEGVLLPAINPPLGTPIIANSKKTGVYSPSTVGRFDRPFERSPHYDRLKTHVHNQLVEGLSTTSVQHMKEHEVGLAALQLLEKALADEQIPMSLPERERLVQELIQEILGFGPIETLLHEESITEIMVNGPHHVFVERNGRLEQAPVAFRDDAHLMHVIERIVSLVGRRVDEKNPLVDARIKAPGKPYDGSRFNAIIPPLALDGPSVTIRKFKKDAGNLDKLMQWGSLSAEMAELLSAAVRARLNIIISGGTGSGKTTMLNSLSSLINVNDRIVTIEDAAELQLQQPHVVRLESRPPNIEGEGAIPIRKLLMNSLRMRPDRIIVGECRAGETLDMLQAMNTGHDGSLTTLHANTPRDALSRIETMCLMNDNTLPEKALRQQVASAVHLIVQVNRLSDGTRKTTSITEIAGLEGDTITLSEIFNFVQTGIDEQGHVLGYHTATGLRPRFADHCAAKGIVLGNHLFQSKEAIHLDGNRATSLTATPHNNKGIGNAFVGLSDALVVENTVDSFRQRLRTDGHS